jgi:hypothetical protein
MKPHAVGIHLQGQFSEGSFQAFLKHLQAFIAAHPEGHLVLTVRAPTIPIEEAERLLKDCGWDSIGRIRYGDGPTESRAGRGWDMRN